MERFVLGVDAGEVGYVRAFVCVTRTLLGESLAADLTFIGALASMSSHVNLTTETQGAEH